MLTNATLFNAALRIWEHSARHHHDNTQFSCWAVNAEAGGSDSEEDQYATQEYHEVLLAHGGSTGGAAFQNAAVAAGLYDNDERDARGARYQANLNRTLFLLLLIESGACD